ncbi:CAMK/CAMK1 protein kinase [Emergomyces africanus]|uniref:CAMK/CAMK1 protein kinase n=1 Tax=Emergomyces africanus TaxID=1955775 RepID=A0A1B7P3M4_9EURO|nr:CAMK/CAMK1 protein kinase [Emergomyces africanus]
MTSSVPKDSSSSSSRPTNLVGVFRVWNHRGKGCVGEINVYSDKELIIGRNPNLCQAVVSDDMHISNKHLRVYTIIFDKGNPGKVGPLVYAQNLSRNGTMWDNTHMNKEHAGVLLSDGDQLKLSHITSLTFQARTLEGRGKPFGDVQRKEMRRFEARFKITHRLLGCGAYGKVYMAIGKEHKQQQHRQLACKIIDISHFKKQLNILELIKRTELRVPRPASVVDVQKEMGTVKHWAERRRDTLDIQSKLQIYKREVDILKDLNHPNIIHLEKVFRSQNTIYIFQELVTAGDLFSFLEYKKFNLSDSETAVIVRQVAVAISYLHDHNIVHRDIKPDNILMTSLSDGARVILTDFGCARRLEKKGSRMMTSMGTVEYTAPEVTQSMLPGSRKGYTKAVDMWSLGCLTVVLLTGGSPFTDQETGKYSQDMAINCDLSTLEHEEDWQRVGLSAKDFVRKLLVLDEDARMTAAQALLHKWFTNLTYKKEFDELYQRAAQQWKPKRNRVVSHQNIDVHPSANCVKLGRNYGGFPRERSYIPYSLRLHEILYSPANSAKQPGKEGLSCMDMKNRLRIYPCEYGEQVPERAGSATFSQMEQVAESHRILPPPEMGRRKDKYEDEDKKADVRGVKSVVEESCSEPVQPNNFDNNTNSGPAGETNGSRIRIPFSPDAWNEEQKLPNPVSGLTKGPKVVHAYPLPNTPPKPQLPNTPYLQPLKMTPIEYERDNMNKNNNIVIKDLSLPEPKVCSVFGRAQKSRICEAYNKSNEKGKNDTIRDGSSDPGGNVNDDIDDDDIDDDAQNGEQSPAPFSSTSPRKLKRSIYDFMEEDEDDEVFEEVDDRISGKRRRIVYGEGNRCC